MAHIADHPRTDFVQSVQEHGGGGAAAPAPFFSDEATRQVQLACGQPPAGLCDALRWLSARGQATALTLVAVQLHPSGLLLTVTCGIARDQQSHRRCASLPCPLPISASPYPAAKHGGTGFGEGLGSQLRARGARKYRKISKGGGHQQFAGQKKNQRDCLHHQCSAAEVQR